MRLKFFAYDEESGFLAFKTAEEAKSYAEEIIDHYRDGCYDGWDECVENVCWGEIKELAVEINTGDKCEFDGELVDCVDYKLGPFSDNL
jgi:hypothetical protein